MDEVTNERDLLVGKEVSLSCSLSFKQRRTMLVRYKTHPEVTGYSGEFNQHAIGEVIVQAEWGADSAFVKELDVYIESKKLWIDMRTAFLQGDLINDNYNTRFFEPTTQEDKERGFTLT